MPPTSPSSSASAGGRRVRQPSRRLLIPRVVGVEAVQGIDDVASLKDREVDGQLDRPVPSWEGHRVRLDDRARVAIDGVPVTKYVIQRDYLFGMGDNRDNSLDSRFWGFIPQENIVGSPMIVYWSWDPDLPLASIVDKIASIRLGRIGTLIR